MPGNILNADTGFPTFAEGEDSNAKIDKVMNYLYMLLEQLRYSLSNLDADNFNETGLKEITDGIARPLQTSFENEFGKTNALIEGWSNEYGSQIKLLTEWKGTASQSISSLTQKADANAASIKLLTEWKGTASESISSLTQKADANAASITLLTEWKGDMSDSLAAVQTKAGQNEAQITSLVQWKNTAVDDIDGLSETMAVIKATADENGAQINQIVSAIGKDGEVTFASIAAGVAENESFIDMVADKIKITADMLVLDSNVYITGVDDDETMLKIMGNRIALNHLHSADSGAGMGFWYDGIDNELLAQIYTDRDTDRPDDSRYTFNINAYSRGDKYPVAMKLSSEGGMSLESWSSIYAWAYSYLTLAAERNVRIRAEVIYDFAVDPDEGGFPCDENDYVFTTDGIYYNGECILPV